MGRATVFVCGDRHRRDDGAAQVAADRLTDALRGDVVLRRVGQLGPDDLVAATATGRCLVIDAVRGIPPGSVVALPLGELGAAGPASASSHALPLPTVIALAEALGADLARAAFVGIGGETFELGRGLSPRVEAALDGYVAEIGATLLRQDGLPCA
jgi:hydrogenase maturation protease